MAGEIKIMVRDLTETRKQAFLALLNDEDFRVAITHHLMDDSICRSIVVKAISHKVYEASNDKRDAHYWRKFLSVSLFFIAMFAKDIITTIIERIHK